MSRVGGRAGRSAAPSVPPSGDTQPAATRDVPADDEMIVTVNSATGSSVAGSVAQSNSEALQANGTAGSSEAATANTVTGSGSSAAALTNSAVINSDASPVEKEINKEMEVQTVMSCSQKTITDNDECEESEDDSSSLFEAGKINDLYSLDEINDFLNDSFGKAVKVSEYFDDADKFIRSATID